MGAGGGRPTRGRGWLCAWLLVLATGFVVLMIGSPLWGHGVFAATDMLTGRPHTVLPPDTVDAALPQADLFAAGLRHGHWFSWNPFIGAGVPLAATPNVGLASPLVVLPYLLLPAWLAPAYVKLLEACCAIGGCYLYLRRIRLGREAALLGGVVFAGSGFMIVWTNWPQTRVAAFIPALFWAVERLVQRRRAWDSAVIALVVAALFFGGFPAITGWTLYTAAGYTLVRALAEYRRDGRRLAGVVSGAIAGVAGGFALAAVQLVPFGVFMTRSFIGDRHQDVAMTLRPAALLTTVAPWAFGTNEPERPPAFFLFGTGGNLIESMSYLGAAALVLVLLALTGYRRGRRLLPPGVLPAVVLATLAWLELCYLGGPPLRLLLRLPVFNINFIGRAHVVLGFLLAVLAAVGFHLLVQREPAARAVGREPAARTVGPQPVAQAAGWERAARTAPAPRAVALPASRRLRPAAALGWVAALGGLAALWVFGRGLVRAGAPDLAAARMSNLDRQVLVAAALIAVAGLLVVAVRRGGRRLRAAGLALLPVLLVGQTLTVTTPFLARSPRASYYPRTDVVQYLAANLGADRMASGYGLMAGIETAYRLRALDAHTYVNRRLTELLDAVPGWAMVYNARLQFAPDLGEAASPVLDRLAVKYFVTPPTYLPFGVFHGAPITGRTTLLAPGQTAHATVAGSGPLRGVVVNLVGAVGADSVLAVVLRNQAGAVVAQGSRTLLAGDGAATPATGWAASVPISGEGLPAGAVVNADLTVTGGPVQVSTLASGAPGLGVVRPGGDDLRMVFAGSAVVYERPAVLPRIRWAARDVVITDPAARVAALSSGTVPADTVVLSAPTDRPAQGAAAQLGVARDQPDSIEATVRAEGAGYLVVADALQVGWSATVDGHRVPIVAADHAVAAVPVPAGTHRVGLHYTAPLGNAGGWLSLGAVLLVLLIGAAEVRTHVRDRVRAGPSKGVPDVDIDAAGDAVHRGVPAPTLPAPVGRHSSAALLQRGGPRTGRDRQDH